MNNFNPQDWVRQVVRNEGIDTNKIFGIRYIGDEDSGLILIAATTNDITLTHGDLASEAADATVGATGVLDLTTYTTIALLLDEINSSANWEAWAVDLPGPYLTNVSSGNGIFIVASPWDAAVQCKTTAGVFPLRDTSLGTIEDFGVGLTFNGPSSAPHGSDANVLHEVLKITALATFAGATDGVYVYECDDVAGTKKEIAHFALVSAADTTFGTGDEPLFATKGKRIVALIQDASAELTAVGSSSPRIEIFSRSLAYGPAMRKIKMLSSL